MTTTLPESELAQLLAIAKKAAYLAGDIQKSSLGTGFSIGTKSSGVDLVTAIDHACDEAICKFLKQERPDDLLFTEETYEEGQPIDFSRTWVVDPIDGTTNYAHGLPWFAVSIAYVVDNVPQVGVVYNPMVNACFAAAKGMGATLNDEPMSVSTVQTLNKALVATGFPYDRQATPKDNLGYFETFMAKSQGVRRIGSAALDMAYLAAGNVDGFWELRLSPWDVAAGILLVEEAGGRVSTFTGEPLPINTRRVNILASNNQGSIHDEIVAICQDSPIAALTQH